MTVREDRTWTIDSLSSDPDRRLAIEWHGHRIARDLVIIQEVRLVPSEADFEIAIAVDDLLRVAEELRALARPRSAIGAAVDRDVAAALRRPGPAKEPSH